MTADIDRAVLLVYLKAGDKEAFMRPFLRLFSCFVPIFCALLLASEAYAAFDLAIAPRKGGQNIRFVQSEPGTLLQNEEVTFTVTNDTSTPYQILQTVYQPLTNELGNTIPQNAFIQFCPSTEIVGTLKTQLETPISIGEVPIYFSNAAGGSDSFIMVYNVRVPEDQPGGVYYTRLSYTIEPTRPAPGVTPETITLEVRVDLRPTFRLEIKSPVGGRKLTFERLSKEKRDAQATLILNAESNIGTRYRIAQQLTSPIISQEGTSLDEEALTVQVFKSEGLEPVTVQPAPVADTPAALFTSGDRGESAFLQAVYTLSPPLEQKAGLYSGNLSFKVESDSTLTPADIINVPIHLEIETVFSLDVGIDETGKMHFGTYVTGTEKEERKILLKVKSNLGEPYQITQIVPRRLMNEEGEAVPTGQLTYFASETKTGAVEVTAPLPVKEGETVVFTSDKIGTPEEFVLNYALVMPKDIKSGNYNSEIKYSITTL